MFQIRSWSYPRHAGPGGPGGQHRLASHRGHRARRCSALPRSLGELLRISGRISAELRNPSHAKRKAGAGALRRRSAQALCAGALRVLSLAANQILLQTIVFKPMQQRQRDIPPDDKARVQPHLLCTAVRSIPQFLRASAGCQSLCYKNLLDTH